MSADPFQPVKIHNTMVSWFTVSGRVKGLRRYSQTHTIPGSDKMPDTTVTEQVTEFWIKRSVGADIPVVLRWDLLLAEGHRVSAVHSGIAGRSKSAWLVLVNHDAGSAHYLETQRGFLHHAGLIFLLPRWVIFPLLGVCLLACWYFWGRPSLAQNAFITALCLAPSLVVGSFMLWQSWQVRQDWKTVDGIGTGMVNALLLRTDDIAWPETIDVHPATGPQ